MHFSRPVGAGHRGEEARPHQYDEAIGMGIGLGAKLHDVWRQQNLEKAEKKKARSPKGFKEVQSGSGNMQNAS